MAGCGEPGWGRGTPTEPRWRFFKRIALTPRRKKHSQAVHRQLHPSAGNLLHSERHLRNEAAAVSTMVEARAERGGAHVGLTDWWCVFACKGNCQCPLMKKKKKGRKEGEEGIDGCRFSLRSRSCIYFGSNNKLHRGMNITDSLEGHGSWMCWRQTFWFWWHYSFIYNKRKNATAGTFCVGTWIPPVL